MTSAKQSSRDAVNGMLLLDKPQGVSSNKALQICKNLLNAKKAGHTGSLDPLATGLLPLCFGKATKISGMFLDADKRYEVSIRLGVSTDSGDCDGEVLETRPVDVARADLEGALDTFRGDILQIPPMFSALKKDGVPLYKLARKGVEIERAPREVSVRSLDILEFANDRVDIDIRCSKGFYVRSLAMDLGNLLGTGAMVESLRRTAVGKFSIEQSVTVAQLEALEPGECRQNLVLPADEALAHLPKIDLNETSTRYFCQGQAVRAIQASQAGLARLYSNNNQFLGLGEVTKDGRVAPKRLFV